MDVIEHVDKLDTFLKSLSLIVKDNGFIFLSSLNPGMLSRFITITMAEDVLRWVPQGTHDEGKYVNNEDLTEKMSDLGCERIRLDYYLFNPVTNTMEKEYFFKLHYIMAFRK